MLVMAAAITPRANAGALIPGSYPLSLIQSADQSGLVISSANQSEIPASAYGDQGYTVNSWSTDCNCMGNPYLNNNDTLRVIAYNPGTGSSQVNGVSIYAVGGAANADGIGATAGLHVVEVANNSGSMWAIDTMQADSPNQAGYAGPGRYLDNELDMNIGGAQTVATWLSMGGTLLASPAYAAGLTLNYIGAGKIREFIYSYDGMADVGLHLGTFSKQSHPNDGSQSVQMDWRDSLGNKNSLFLTAYNDTMVLQSTDKAAPAAWAVDGAAGIYANIHVTQTCTLVIKGGLVTGTQGNC